AGKVIAMDMFDLDVEALRKAKRAARQRVYNKANKEKEAARKKAYREANKEKFAARYKAYYEANKEKVAARHKAYREANKEKVAAHQKAYCEANKEKRAAQNKAYREANKEKEAAQTKAYREANKEKLFERRAQRRFRKTYIINHLLVAQRGKCASCHVNVIEKHHLDHIVPLANGGTHDRSNFQLLCPACNLSKHVKDPLAFMQERGKLC
ncbi:MAG: hypothetical protein EBR82_66465, partial [Caulobacteraceae bacterium]|nr:hypothetical protein [Caulobacteraceae bacterium]